jgi:hypothetical protein
MKTVQNLERQGWHIRVRVRHCRIGACNREAGPDGLLGQYSQELMKVDRFIAYGVSRKWITHVLNPGSNYEKLVRV